MGDNAHGATSYGASDFNEWYKVAAWNGTKNVSYGFGRDTYNGSDANYSGSGDPYESFTPGTTPVGYYNGTSHGGSYQTTSNQNHYGVFDLSGNVDELMTDGWGSQDAEYVGSGWSDQFLPISFCRHVNRYDANSYIGFRIVTTTP